MHYQSQRKYTADPKMVAPTATIKDAAVDDDAPLALELASAVEPAALMAVPLVNMEIFGAVETV